VDPVRVIALAIGAYLVGSIPTGFIVAKTKGIDIRSLGSGNIGATNVFRVLGRPAGVFVLGVDFLKGLIACGVLPWWTFSSAEFAAMGSARVAPFIVAGICAVLGHNFTLWLRFRGGKGIATSAGVLTALVPWALLIILGIWIILFAVTRYVSVGSLAASFTLPFATYLTTRNWALTIMTLGLAVLAFYRHRGNIRRLFAGTESRLAPFGKGASR
jgi:glycerol-3-phosphate acyltransferase PlsY